MMQGVDGLSLASTAAQAASGMFSAVTEANADKGQAAAYRENARLDLLQGAIQSEDIRRRGRAVQGEAIAANAENGGGAMGQSAQDLIFQNALEIEYASANARYGAAEAARGDLYKAAEAKRAGKAALIGGVMRAGAAAITGMQGQRDAAAQKRMMADRYAAFFPGGQRLPMPTGPYSPPVYRPSGGGY